MLARVETGCGVVEIRPAQVGEGERRRPILFEVMGTELVRLGVTPSELRQVARAALAIAEEVEAREREESQRAAYGYAFNMIDMLQCRVRGGG